MADVADELQFHIDARVDELVRGRATPEEARASAHREFGDVAATQAELSAIDRERAQGERRTEMRDFVQDVRGGSYAEVNDWAR